MGRWFARFLLKDGKDVVITGRDQQKLRQAKRQLGVEVATNVEAVKKADVVLLSVLMDNFEGVVAEISPYIRPDHVVIDITSIKTLTVDIMHKHLKSASVLGTHPMFGPGARGLANHNFVLTPTSDAEKALAHKVRDYLEARGAKITLMTPREHDEMMSVILGLCHFIALVSADTLLSFDRLKQLDAIGGITYKVLLTLVEGVLSEDPDTYAALQMNLSNVVAVEALFQEKVKIWADLVRNRDKPEFVDRMSRLKSKLKGAYPDFEKAYRNMYELVERL